MVKGPISPELKSAYISEVRSLVISLKDYPYQSGAFPMLMEHVARILDTPNQPINYKREIFDYLSWIVIKSARESDITPTYVSIRIQKLQELALRQGLKISVY